MKRTRRREEEDHFDKNNTSYDLPLPFKELGDDGGEGER